MTHLPLSPLLALAQDQAAASATKSLFDYIRAGGVMGYILLALSFAAVTLMIVCVIRLRLANWAPPTVVEGLGRLLRDHDIPGAQKFCADPANECFTTAVVGTALARCSRSVFGFLELRAALEEAGQVETDRQHKPLDFVALVAALGPMLGLLGTVIGLIGAFGSLAELEGAARSKELAGFMALALVNTAQGLAVAIPCTAFYAAYKRRVDRLATDAARLVEDLAMPLEGKQAGPKPAPARPGQRPVAPPATPRPAPAPGVAPQ